MNTEQQSQIEQTKQKNNLAIPVSIVIAGAFIALGVYLSGSNGNTAQVPTPGQPQEVVDTTDQVRKVTKDDHIKGNPKAEVTIVEYSDFECPFCKRHHDTMNKIVSERDDVRLVFRQFPLDSLHPKNARKAAVASECVNKLGGNDAFWKFIDEYFRTTPTNDRWNIDDELDRLVKFAGVDKKVFDTCYTSGEFDKHVQDDVDNAIATGGRGTPWNVIITKSGKTMPLNGAQSESTINQLIDIAKKN